MREIKFLARHKESGEWRTFNLSNLCDGRMTERYMWNHWREFTGLKDKNDAEIYEGHICRIWHNEHYTGAATYLPEEGGWYLCNREGKKTQVFSFAIHCVPNCSQPIEVIGNIYENPELLTKDK